MGYCNSDAKSERRIVHLLLIISKLLDPVSRGIVLFCNVGAVRQKDVWVVHMSHGGRQLVVMMDVWWWVRRISKYGAEILTATGRCTHSARGGRETTLHSSGLLLRFLLGHVASRSSLSSSLEPTSAIRTRSLGVTSFFDQCNRLGCRVSPHCLGRVSPSLRILVMGHRNPQIKFKIREC